MREGIENFRKTICYKICGWIGTVTVPTMLLIIWYGTTHAQQLELAGALVAAVIYLQGLVFSILFAALNIGAFIELKHQDKKTQSKTNIFADLGYIASLIMFVFILKWAFLDT